MIQKGHIWVRIFYVVTKMPKKYKLNSMTYNTESEAPPWLKDFVFTHTALDSSSLQVITSDLVSGDLSKPVLQKSWHFEPKRFEFEHVKYPLS